MTHQAQKRHCSLTKHIFCLYAAQGNDMLDKCLGKLGVIGIEKVAMDGCMHAWVCMCTAIATSW